MPENHSMTLSKDFADPRRVLTLIPASSIVISSMIGTGIFTTTGLMAAMGVDGFMPSSFSKLNRRKVPATAVFVQASVAALFAVTSSFGPLLIYIGFTLTIFAGLTVLSLFRLRKRSDIKRVCVAIQSHL